MAPLFDEENTEDDTCHSADVHIEFLKSVLKDVKIFKNTSNISVKLVGCASHRLNLSLGMYLDDYEGILSKINSLMKDLKKLNNAARLRY
ncbi:hypothetical protein F441_03650 [Phytophthora nicotianae CJ01A1]|uniref:Uncharacterized protein n=3 Tax=Phytophthora nicotianae TaxID=4792 RepID=W2PDA1_PHYN3|nr:hypothetical protein PPTG_24549 [Phytophthora nicotianae INRA-310]ETK86411.1 hypothetical protein L915_08955 [Phytophthora nicotianae]ETM98796.1 hypothetical protein PPTG_24549 [Phytophthora nicotianae INRA-310]ETP23174.1 hypothetical protein F441_03650 [Phytophthora nicotianae CJ01A1]